MSNKILSPINDSIFKLLFGDERNIDILINFLSSVLNISPEEYEELVIIDPHLKREYPEDKLGILDVKVHTKYGNIINLEMQTSEVPEMPERVLFYTSKMCTEQINKGDEFHVIKKVISIIILDFNLIKDSEYYHNVYYLYDKNTNSEFTKLLEIHTLELQKLPKESDNTKLYYWLRFFKAEKEEDYKMLIEKNPEIRKPYVILKELSEEERVKILEEAKEKQRRDDASRMRGAYNRGLDDGINKGINQGISQGAQQRNIEIIRNLYEKKMLIKDISNLLELPVKELLPIIKEFQKSK